MAAWLAYAGNIVTQKFVGLRLPIAAFVAAGLEHFVAHIYLLPYAFLVKGVMEGTTASISLAGIAGNLVAATIGNIIGGSLVALAYGYVYAKSS